VGRPEAAGQPQPPLPPVPPVPPPAASAAQAERRSSAEMPAQAAPAQPAPPRMPLLLDVTPRTLGVVAAGGYCEDVIERNSPVPTEQTRIFATSQDGQTEVQIRVYQGENRRIEQNQELGVIDLLGLKPAPRGRVQIEVTFIIDADGILRVSARDMVTGQQKRARISLRGQLSDEQVVKLQQRHAKLTSGG
jgi:molecular chaperone DnaK